MNKIFCYIFDINLRKTAIFFKIFAFFLFMSNINTAVADDFKVVARVNDKIITKYDLDNYSKIIQISFDNKIITPEIKREILNNLIEEILKSEAVDKEKIEFDEDEFGYYVDGLKDREHIEENIKKYGVNRDIYIKLLKINFLWSKLIDTKIRSKVSITGSEVNDSLEYLSDNPLRTRYNISQLTIYKTANNDPKLIVDKLYQEIKNKNNFESIAEKFSQENKKNKGYIGWVDEMDINETIYNAIKNLQVGSISKPVYFGDQNSGYYMIIKLNDKKQEKVAKRDDIARVQYFIYNQKLNLEIKNYLDALYNNAFIEIY